MTECHLKGMLWFVDGRLYCGMSDPSPCKICNLMVCIMHSISFSDGRACESCIALRLPEKTVGSIIGKDYFSKDIINRVKRIYLTNTKACKK
tara:strand:+ start:226 stop:501 length:276 start_codon:yes stop_codon:yes gene_type:complete